MNNSVIKPGSIICILGGGQLGKMTLVAAHQMGYRTMVWAPPGDNPAMEMATHRLVRPYDCPETLTNVLSQASVITTEWENIPLGLIRKLESHGGIVRPGSKVLEVAQSRRLEKMMARELQIPTTKTVFFSAKDFNADGLDLSEYLPGILKTDGLGYDGKGQWRVNTPKELFEAHDKAGVDCVLEKMVSLRTELSILVARSPSGQINLSDVVENTHKDGILDTTIWPLENASEFEIKKICKIAERVADHLGLEGILALEFFVDTEGNLLFNEMAPRPHNSFHGSIEAVYTSQFEQHVRAICDLPLGNVRFCTQFEMTNLIGGTWEDWSKILGDPTGRLHLYGKAESRPGRKMGHVTQLFP